MASRKLELELDLPEELFPSLGSSQQEVIQKVREVLVLYLLRQKEISQGKAAEILGISRSDLFDLMAEQDIPVLELSEEELKEGLVNLKGAIKG